MHRGAQHGAKLQTGAGRRPGQLAEEEGCRLAERFEPEQLAEEEAELADEEAELHADTHVRDGALGL